MRNCKFYPTLVDLQLFLPQTNFRPLHCDQSVHQFHWIKIIKTNMHFYCFLFFDETLISIYMLEYFICTFNWVKFIKNNMHFYCFLFFIYLLQVLVRWFTYVIKVWTKQQYSKVNSNQIIKINNYNTTCFQTSISLILPTSRASKLKFSTIPFLNLPFGGSNLILLYQGY